MENNLTRTPYLVLFVILLSIGVGTASAMITITLAGNVHITGDTTTDGKVGIGTLNPDSALHIIGSGSDFTPNRQGIQLTGSDSSSSPGIEITGDGEPPYIDFQNDISGTDFDGRIILMENDVLSVSGASLNVNGDLEIDGDYQYNTNKTKILSISHLAFVPDRNSELEYHTIWITNLRDKQVDGDEALAYAPISGIPDGAKIKQVNCYHYDNDPTNDYRIQCGLYFQLPNLGAAVSFGASSETTSGNPGISKLTKEYTSAYYNATNPHFLYLSMDPVGNNCADFKCSMLGMEVIYEVSKVD